MSEWQPIETAPTTGLIDVWCDERRYIDCYWDYICGEYRTLIRGQLFRLRQPRPTHWMPIPEPPK